MSASSTCSRSVTTRSRGRCWSSAPPGRSSWRATPACAGGDVTVVALRPLTEAQSERLVLSCSARATRSQALLVDVRQKADGNPFFLEEILQRLIDEGAIVREDGRWVATERALRSGCRTRSTHFSPRASTPCRPTRRPPPAGRGGRSDLLAGIAAAAADGRDHWPLRSLERRGLVSARPTLDDRGPARIHLPPRPDSRRRLCQRAQGAASPRSRRDGLVDRETGRRPGGGVREVLAYHYAAAVAGEDADLAWAGRPDERERAPPRAPSKLRCNAGQCGPSTICGRQGDRAP